MQIVRRRILWVAAAVVLGAWLLAGRYGVLTRIRLERNSTELDSAIARQRRINDSLRHYRRWLETDTTAIERLARERYGMIRPGETVLLVVDSLR